MSDGIGWVGDGWVGTVALAGGGCCWGGVSSRMGLPGAGCKIAWAAVTRGSALSLARLGMSTRSSFSPAASSYKSTSLSIGNSWR